MIYANQLAWMKEFLLALAGDRPEDRKSVEEIVDTFRALYVVLGIAKTMVVRPPAQYSPNSRKGKLQDALKPFIKVVPDDRSLDED